MVLQSYCLRELLLIATAATPMLLLSVPFDTRFRWKWDVSGGDKRREEWDGGGRGLGAKSRPAAEWKGGSLLHF